MFSKNDLVVYEDSGVCEISDICELSFTEEDPRTYYILRPIFFKDDRIYTPVNNPKVTLRPVISREEALSILHSISQADAPADVKRGIDVRLRFDLRRHQGSKPESAAVGCPVSRCASPPSRRCFRRQSVRYFDRYRGSSSFFHSQTKKGGHGQRTHDRLWKLVRAALRTNQRRSCTSS